MKLHLPKGLRTALIAAISLFSGFAATVGSAAYADSILPPLVDDAGNKTIVWHGGKPTGWNRVITSTTVATTINNYGLDTPGWHAFVGNQNLSAGGGETSATADGFKFYGRNGYGGEAVVASMSVKDILAGTTDNTLTSLTVSFSGTAMDDGIYFSVWAWDGTTATALVSPSKIAAGTFDTQTYTADSLSLTQTDTILLSWSNSSAGKLNIINNPTATFTSTYDAANEGPRDLTWDLGANCNWADEVWTLNGGKVAFKDGDNIYFPMTDVGYRTITVDGNVAVGKLTVQAGNDDATAISGKAGSTISVDSISIEKGGILAFAGFDEITFKTVSLKEDAELDFRGLSGTVTVTDKMTDVAANTIILANSVQAGGKSQELHLSANYSTPDEINKAINSIASLQSLVDKWYIDDGDVDNLDKLGVVVFTTKQGSVQPGGAACSLDIDKRKVVFDKGIAFFGSSFANGTQSVNVKNRGEMTVNDAALENLRMTINVTTGGKLTATEGIILGHPENGNYPAWLNLKSAEITTKTITSRNKDASTAFTMSSEVYQLPGNPRPTEQGGTLTITGDSAFGLANTNSWFTVNLNAGTLTSTADSMNLVDAAYADSSNLTISVGGTFNITAKEGNTITINHALGGSGTGTGTASGTLVFNGAGTVAIADGVSLGNVSFNQTDGTLSLAGPITLGDTATFTQTAGKKILLTALEGGDGITFSNYEGGSAGNGLKQGGTADVIIGGTLNSDVVVTYNGKDYTLTNDNRSLGAAGGASTIYYVNTGTADMSKITAFSADITTVELAGGNLILDTAKPDAVALDVTADSTLTISNGITINKTDLTVGTGKTLTLAGEGTYALTDATLGATLGTDWTGTVKLADCTINGLAPNSYANTAGGSSVELSGVDGYFARSNTSAANIILTNSGDKAAYSVTNGYTGTTVTFNGDVSGTGDFQRGNNKGGTQGYTFNGDVSGWTGKVELASGADATNFTFGGKATEINASVVQKSGAALGLNITNNEAVAINGTIGADGGTGAINLTTSGTGAKTFNGAVDATSLTVSAGSAIIKDSLTATGTVTIASGATLDLSGASSASAGALNLAGGSTLVIGSDAMALTGLTLTGVSGSSLLNIQGLGAEAVLFTGLAAEADITNITFTDKQGKRVANAADYISGVESGTWLVYDATATTLSFASSLSPDLYWTTGTGTWDAAALWSKTPDGTADSTFVEEGNITFSGQTGVTVTLAEPATAGGVTIKDGGYTFAGGRLTVLKGLTVTNADATFQDGVVLDNSNVTIGAGSTLTLGADTTMKGLSNEGTVDLGDNKLTLSTATSKGGTVTAGDVALTGDNSFTKLNASGAVSGASALTVGDGSSMGSLADGTALTTAGTVTIGADTTLAGLDNGGTLDLGDNSLTLTTATTKGGSVNAKDVTLTGDNTFTSLNTTGAVSGASALSVGDGSSMGSLADGTALTTAGTVTIGADTSLKALDNGGTLDLGDKALTLTAATTKGGTVTAGNVTLTGDNTFTQLTVNGGTLTLGAGTLEVTGELAGVTTLEIATLPANGPVIKAGSLTSSTVALATSNDSLMGITLSATTPWVLAELGSEPTATFSFVLDGTDIGDSLAVDDMVYKITTADNNIVVKLLRGGNQWNGAANATWDNNGDAWSHSKAPSETETASFLGGGDAEVEVVGTQTAKKVIVDASQGSVSEYTFTGDEIQTGAMEITNGGVTIANTVTVSSGIASGTGETQLGGTVDGSPEASLTVADGGKLVTDAFVASSVGKLDIEEGGELETAAITFEDGAGFQNKGTLKLTSGNLALDRLADNEGTVIMDSLNGTENDMIGGTIQLRNGGTYSGGYNEGTQVDIISPGASMNLTANQNLTIGGTAGTHNLKVDAQHSTLGGIKTNGATVVLNNLSGTQTTTVTLANASEMKGGQLVIGFSATHAGMNAGDVNSVDKAFTGAAIKLSGVSILLKQIEPTTALLKSCSATGNGVVLYVISDAEDSTFDEATTLTVDAPMLEKYFSNFRLQQGSIEVIADREQHYYTRKIGSVSENGNTGLNMADAAMNNLTPQLGAQRTMYPDLASVLDTLDRHALEGNTQAADRLGAALAGAATTTLGAAVSADMDRQLRAMRNRTTCMGASECTVIEDNPPTFWFNAEGDYRRLNSTGTEAGYTLNSWGLTTGVDYNVNNNLTIGAAFTYMFGDLSAQSPEDSASGDLNTCYASLIGRYAKGAWVHTLVASVGITNATLDRTYSTDAGIVHTNGGTNGVSFGMLYEVGYIIPMDSDGKVFLQPIANIAYKRTALCGYTESGSDAALTVGKQTMDSVTFGAGARVQAVVGQSVYNREIVTEARALAKFEVGDLYSDANVSLRMLPDSAGRVKGAKLNPFGVELGAGMFVPVGVDSGTLFFDISAELRDNTPNVNGTVGYRFKF